MKTNKLFNWQNLCLFGAGLIILVLFISSSMPYTKQTSVPFLEQHLAQKPLENWLSQISFRYAGKEISIANIGYYKFVEFFIRKGAHFGTYFLLGGLTALGLARYWSKLGHVAFVSWALATLYAETDELHQMLTGDRTPLIQDVILDSCGALLGVMLAVLFLYRLQKRRNR